MEEEMRFHLAMEEQYLSSRGSSLDQARRRARISFGPELQGRDQTVDAAQVAE